jgi:signal peptidase II
MIKNNLITVKLFYCLFVAGIIFIIDRIAKIYIINNNENIIYVYDYLNLELVWNTGIGFGLLSLNAGILYNIISLIILIIVFLLIYLIVKSDKFESIFYSMIAGGAVGNLYDRITYFAVPDFIDMHFHNYHWFTFNVADIFITLGIILILLKDLIFKKSKL